MKTIRIAILLLSVLALSACATRLTKPQGPALAPATSIQTYERIILTPITISPEFAKHDSNQDARVKMNDYLQKLMQVTFKGKNLQIVSDESEINVTEQRTLIIKPHIKEIKYVNTAARIFAGAMAGGSAVLMEVSMIDTNGNRSIGNPEFYADASAWSGFGADNRVLNEVIEDIDTYFKIHN